MIPKKYYIPYIPLIEYDYSLEIKTTIEECLIKIEGCQHKFIRTMKKQPCICTKCLNRLGALNDFISQVKPKVRKVRNKNKYKVTDYEGNKRYNDVCE